MKLKVVVVDLEVSARTKRWALGIGVPLALLLGGSAIAWAAGLHTWNTGDTLQAADLNANFQALAAGQTPAQVVANFNAAVDGGAAVTLGAINAASPKFDLRWAMQHAAAAGACAAVSMQDDSADGHVVIPRGTGVTCTAACLANTGGTYPNCKTQIAVGAILPTQATAYTDVISMNYNYDCNNLNGGDEVMGQGLEASNGTYTDYCCCYH
jgi:hypothetical protein